MPECRWECVFQCASKCALRLFFPKAFRVRCVFQGASRCKNQSVSGIPDLASADTHKNLADLHGSPYLVWNNRSLVSDQESILPVFPSTKSNASSLLQEISLEYRNNTWGLLASPSSLQIWSVFFHSD